MKNLSNKFFVSTIFMATAVILLAVISYMNMQINDEQNEVIWSQHHELKKLHNAIACLNSGGEWKTNHCSTPYIAPEGWKMKGDWKVEPMR